MKITLPTAIRPTTAAAMASPLSMGLNVAAAGVAAVRGAGIEAGRWAIGAACARGALALGAGAEPAEDGPVGPPGGSVGNLIVGAADGLGGRLMRTVSFLGWTLPVSFFGGTAPLGVGMLSAITYL